MTTTPIRGNKWSTSGTRAASVVSANLAQKSKSNVCFLFREIVPPSPPSFSCARTSAEKLMLIKSFRKIDSYLLVSPKLELNFGIGWRWGGAVAHVTKIALNIVAAHMVARLRKYC